MLDIGRSSFFKFLCSIGAGAAAFAVSSVMDEEEQEQKVGIIEMRMLRWMHSFFGK